MDHEHRDRQLIAMAGPPGLVITTRDATPYSVNGQGLVHVEAKHVPELRERGFSVVTEPKHEQRIVAGQLYRGSSPAQASAGSAAPLGWGRVLTPSSRR